VTGKRFICGKLGRLSVRSAGAFDARAGSAEGQAAEAIALTPDSSALAVGQVKRQIRPAGA
jgi:hypothetical protein